MGGFELFLTCVLIGCECEWSAVQYGRFTREQKIHYSINRGPDGIKSDT
jgi:hypothetical protein